MFGASRASLPSLLASVAERRSGLDDAAYDQAGQDVLSVVSLLGRERRLRISLADPASSPASKQEVVAALLGGRISPAALGILDEAVAARWSADGDLVDALEQAGAQIRFDVAQSGGFLDSVEEDLFRFTRVLDSDDELGMALGDGALAMGAKQGIVGDLLGSGRANQLTVDLVSFVVSNTRGRRLDSVLTELSDLAATRRGRVVATVTVARPLEADQLDRLTSVLTRIYGPVQVDLDIDPDVIGGVRVQVGDEIIDGSISGRLEQARRAMSS